jgi:hypothetical protein
MGDRKSPIEQQDEEFLKFFELNDEGLKLYAQYKKTQYLRTVKFSFLGTAIGFVLSNILEVTMRRRYSHSSLDLIKTSVFFVTTGAITYNGFQAATMEFKSKQKELVEKYGKEYK